MNPHGPFRQKGPTLLIKPIFFLESLGDINFGDVVIAAPFNKLGFQMDPSKAECEKALASVDGANVIAISILAAGYLKPSEAIEYVAGLPNIAGVSVGVSKEQHARETFRLLKNGLE